MSRSVLATEVCASDRMKHVEASAMHVAATATGRPPWRHCATMLRPRLIQSTTPRNSEAKKLRHRLVVQGLVATRRGVRPPLLPHTAAQTTNNAPRPPDASSRAEGTQRPPQSPRHR